jgi:hypothetical protein
MHIEQNPAAASIGFGSPARIVMGSDFVLRAIRAKV